MTTAGSLAGDLRTQVGDADATFLTDTLCFQWFDTAQKRLVEILQPLERSKTSVVTQYQNAFTIPDEAVMIEMVVCYQNQRRILKHVDFDTFELNQMSIQNAVGFPRIWTEKDGKVYIWPMTSTASLTTTVNASTTAATTAITLASTANLRANGRVIIDSEEIEYTNKTSTTIAGCSRGMGGTTAATHVSAATVTQTDLGLFYTRTAAQITASTQSPEIKPVWHEKLQIYAAYLYYMAEGSPDKAAYMMNLWNDAIKEATYIAERENLAGPMTVKDTETQDVTTQFGPLI